VRIVSLAIWGALVAAVVAAEIAGRVGLGGLAPLGRCLQRARATVVGRVVMVVAWAWLGWHVFAR